MKPKYLLLLILLCSTVQYASAQDLYLKLTNSEKEYATDWEPGSGDPNGLPYEWRVFRFKAYVVYGYMLAFEAERNVGAPAGTTVPIAALSNYPITTIDALEAYLAPMTKKQQGDYIAHFKRYFIVEVNQAQGTAEIIPVRIKPILGDAIFPDE